MASITDEESMDTAGSPRSTLGSPSSDDNSIRTPEQTSSWERIHLIELKMQLTSFCDVSKSPSDIINMLGKYPDIIKALEKGQTSSKTRITSAGEAPANEAAMEARVKDLEGKLRDTLAVLNEEFKTMTIKKAVQLSKQTDLWKVKGCGEDTFIDRFQESGLSFAMWLRHCIYQRDVCEVKVSEFMFQHLFVLFLQMFGVKCTFVPGIPKKTMTVRDQSVSGIPDILASVYLNEKKTLDSKTLFVGEVKRNYDGRSYEPQSKRLRSAVKERPDPMPDTLLGQHGAELLLYYPTSLSDKAIIGMIVEETHVSFTSLTCTGDQYKSLLNGSLKKDTKSGPELVFTRPYDYMVQKDRDDLIEPLLRLGLIQEVGERYLNENLLQ
ncbi:uncharacterized protein LOC117341097 [Pecten maximus]|uniref:uncharacterized protein LOC117341097 n=1 Tax=Pecten maximus TaxID=6579 RepID=UPI0014583633|nr:uncharacterized protein LOC117341097 [Pecten maximus]